MGAGARLLIHTASAASYVAARKVLLPAAHAMPALTRHGAHAALPVPMPAPLGVRAGLRAHEHGALKALADAAESAAAVCLRLGHLAAVFAPLLLLGVPLWMAGAVDDAVLWRWMRFSLGAAGAAFVKLGQWASTRPDVLPRALCEALAALQSEAPVHDMHWNRRVIRESFGCEVETLFAAFCETPLGSGTVAQVHRAQLHNGAAVAVKICHPHVAAAIERDLLLLGIVARAVDWLLPGFRWLSLPAEAATFSGMMRAQLDLRFEARTLHRFARNFAATARSWGLPQRALFPEPYYPLVAARCLVEDLVVDAVPMQRFILEMRSIGGVRGDGGVSVEAGLNVDLNASLEDSCIGNSIATATAAATATALDTSTPTSTPTATLTHTATSEHIRKVAEEVQADLAVLGLQSFLQMLLWDNFVHADLHPGNILVAFQQTDAHSVLGYASGKGLLCAATQTARSIGRRCMNLMESAQRLVWWRLLNPGPLPPSQRPLLRLEGRGPDESLHTYIVRQLELVAAGRLLPVLVFVDAGLVASLSRPDFRNFADLFLALVLQGDGAAAGRLMVERSPEWAQRQVRDADGFCRGMDAVVEPLLGRTRDRVRGRFIRIPQTSLRSLSIGPVLERVFGLVRVHRVRLDPAFTNLVMSLVCVEGVGRQLAPEADLTPLLVQAALQFLVTGRGWL